MNTKFKRTIAALNQIATRELGASVPRKRRKRRPSAFADIKKYRREHPEASMHDAWIACRSAQTENKPKGKEYNPISTTSIVPL